MRMALTKTDTPEDWGGQEVRGGTGTALLGQRGCQPIQRWWFILRVSGFFLLLYTCGTFQTFTWSAYCYENHKIMGDRSRGNNENARSDV